MSVEYHVPGFVREVLYSGVFGFFNCFDHFLARIHM